MYHVVHLSETTLHWWKTRETILVWSKWMKCVKMKRKVKGVSQTRRVCKEYSDLKLKYWFTFTGTLFPSLYSSLPLYLVSTSSSLFPFFPLLPFPLFLKSMKVLLSLHPSERVWVEWTSTSRRERDSIYFIPNSLLLLFHTFPYSSFHSFSDTIWSKQESHDLIWEKWDDKEWLRT